MNVHRPTTESLALEPLVVSSATDVTWDDETDVLVVGFGGAGAAAAIEARENGADVLAIDRFGGGGATHYSGGVFYAGGGTKHQRASGIEDTPEEMRKYLEAERVPFLPETLKRFCDGSSGDLDWVERHGVPFGGNPYLKKTAFPPDPHWLFFSGNENIPAFKKVAKPAPRGHRPVTPAFGGHLHYAKLRDSALGMGVRLMPHAPAKRLILDRGNRVIGVEINAIPKELWAKHEELYAIVSPWKPLNAAKAQQAIDDCRAFEAQVNAPKRIRARSGVILSTGGFINNLDMLGRHRDFLAKSYLGIQRLGSMGCDGSGIALGQSVGGDTGYMDKMFLGRSITPPDAFVYGVIVNASGKRFVNEDAYNAFVGNAISDQPNGKAYLILDRDHFWRGINQSLFPGKGMFLMWGAPALINVTLGGTRRAKTLQALAKKCGIDPAGLEATIRNFNETIVPAKEDPLGRSPDKLVPVSGSSYFAVNVSLANPFSPTWAFTLGGLAVDEQTGNVKTKSGERIEGLYAAGRTAIGLCSNGYNQSGSSIADTVFSGRRAGRDAAQRINQKSA